MGKGKHVNQGILIAIEGTDGSSKATQTKLLHERLVKEGYEVEAFTFPRYDKASSYFVKQYLSGQYGGIDTVNPYTSTLFYALDRYEASKDIRQALDAGKVVITDRYTGSNMAHQGTKFPNAEERRGYFIWNDNLEFSLLNIPRPHASFVLRVPAEIAHKLVAERAKENTARTPDLHEADVLHIQKSVEVYDDLCSLFPADFKRIDCVRSDKLLGIEEIHVLLWEKVSALLPELPEKPTEEPETHATLMQTTAEPTQQVSYLAALSSLTTNPHAKIVETPQANGFHTPAQLLPATKTQYQETMASLLQMQSEIAERLQTKNVANAAAIASSCLPLASYCSVRDADKSLEIQPATKQTRSAQQQIHELLPAFYTAESPKLTLQQTQPRNELDVAVSIVYSQSDLPLDIIQQESTQWSYDQKASLLETALRTTAIDSSYTFDLLCPYSTLVHIANTTKNAQITWQPLTPRNGYDVPIEIDEAGLTDIYERCFDTSLELHSMLQAEGYIAEAQYGTLLGHRVRALLQLSFADIAACAAIQDPYTRGFIREIVATIQERHPIIGEYLQNVLDKHA